MVSEAHAMQGVKIPPMLPLAPWVGIGSIRRYEPQKSYGMDDDLDISLKFGSNLFTI